MKGYWQQIIKLKFLTFHHWCNMIKRLLRDFPPPFYNQLKPLAILLNLEDPAGFILFTFSLRLLIPNPKSILKQILDQKK